MFDETKRVALEHLYNVSGIPFVIADDNGNVVQAYPSMLKDFYFAEYWNAFPGNLSESKYPNGISIICVGDTYHVAIVKLDDTLHLNTVPVSTVQNRNPSFFSSLQKGIRPGRQIEFYRFLSKLPTISNIKLSETVSLAKILYCGEPAYGTNLMYMTESGIPLREVPLDTTMKAAIDYEQLPTMEHMSSELEESVINAIINGDEIALNAAMRRPTYGSIGRMSLNDIRQARYEFICMTYACSRAAIKGGLAHEYSFQLSDLYCQRMDSMNRADEINLYALECMRNFACEVAKNKHTAGYSSYTTMCCEYIRQHLLEPLNVDVISKGIGLNRRSLARYFMNDTGMTIAEYITQKRLEEGAYLLTSSELSLSDISHLLQFSSQSKFTQKFHSKYGTTPAQYRKGIRTGE